jgi:purine-binding chemotaxis protein CheW
MAKKFLVFKLYDELFAIEMKHSREIVPYSSPAPVPSMPPFFEGLVHLRGFFLPVVDTKKLLNVLPKEGKKQKNKIIIISILKKIVGLKIDDVEDIVSVEESRILPAPNLISNLRANFFSGGFYLNEKVILVIDLEKLFTDSIMPYKTGFKEKTS